MKKVIRTMVFMIGILLLSYSSSYAAVIQIKDTTAQVLTNATISDFYVMAEGLKGTGQGLEGTSVDVKMANNYEWAVVSYFSNSAYGTGGAGKNTGVSSSGHYSTNGNITGVMDWGKTYTYTAGIISDYANKTLTTAGNLTSDPTTSAIINNAGTNRVNKFDQSSKYLMAYTSWYGQDGTIGSDKDNPYSARWGLFGGRGGIWHGINPLGVCSGKAYPDVTFRPIVWN